jgi:hypothetical protein
MNEHAHCDRHSSRQQQKREQAKSDPHQMLLEELILLGLQFDQPL